MSNVIKVLYENVLIGCGKISWESYKKQSNGFQDYNTLCPSFPKFFFIRTFTSPYNPKPVPCVSPTLPINHDFLNNETKKQMLGPY